MGTFFVLVEKIYNDTSYYEFSDPFDKFVFIITVSTRHLKEHPLRKHTISCVYEFVVFFQLSLIPPLEI